MQELNNTNLSQAEAEKINAIHIQIASLKKDRDEINKAGDIDILLDPQSAKYLNGARIDYVEDYKGTGFVIDNPNTTGSCGCGNSVSF